MAFKRGFLNSKKGRDALATKATTVAGSETKPLEPVIQNDGGESQRTRSEAPLDLHAPPPWLKRHPGHERYVFRQWPRALDGKVIPKDHPEFGKRTSNGYELWGETLWDFFQTHRVPTNPGLVTYSTGSRLASWMRHFGELDVAAEELAWADAESEPRQIYPRDIGQLISDYERNTAGIHSKDQSSQLPLSRAPKLQARLPFHLLPEKLVVHDPWNTLSVHDMHDEEDDVLAEKDDIVHIFELSLSEEGRKKAIAERKAAKAEDEARLKREEWRVLLPTFEEGPLDPSQIAVHARVPPRPTRPTSIPEAHLYIRREEICGAGNHSVVYFSELELPRWALVDDILCEACFQVALQKEIDERVEAGTFVPDHHKGRDKPAEIKRTKTIVEDLRNISLLTETTEDSELPAHPQANKPASTHHVRTNPRTVVTEEYTGPVVHVYPKVSWHNPERAPVCEHLRIGGLDPPRTARVKVCAKFSIQGDHHLAHEAENYQAFPAHFFEHWNGYNLVYPLHDPTPCGALVPQFYGYYVPQRGYNPVVDDVVVIDSAPASDSPSDPEAAPAPQQPADYISPILLLENCGVPIEVDELSEDDKNACAALYLTCLEGGWTQNSMAERNVVVQPGPITDWPVSRGMSSRQRSFRLIDFGRAKPLKNNYNYILQKGDILRLFKLNM